MTILFVLLFINHIYIITVSQCIGCNNTNNCVSMVNNTVYACKGTFDGGLNGEQAQGLCSETFEICPSIPRMIELGLTRDLCGSTDIPTFNEFYATLVSSDGSAKCEPEGYNGTNGQEDIWGCAKVGGINTGAHVLRTYEYAPQPSGGAYNCSVLTAFISSDDENRNWNSNSWEFQSSTQEISTVSLSSENQGGVMCCLGRTNSPTISPTSNTDNPTISTTIPTDIPTSNPTNTPTTTPSLTPTVSPTDTPTLNPTITPTQTPSNSPSITPTITPSISPSSTIIDPSTSPTYDPTLYPTKIPSRIPSQYPSNYPTESPSKMPAIGNPQQTIELTPWLLAIIIGLTVLICMLLVVIIIISYRSKREKQIIKLNSQKIVELEQRSMNHNNIDNTKAIERVSSVENDADLYRNDAMTANGVNEAEGPNNVTTNNITVDMISNKNNSDSDNHELYANNKTTDGFTAGNDDDSSIEDIVTTKQ